MMEELYKFQIKMYQELADIYNTFKWMGIISVSIVLQSVVFFLLSVYYVDQVKIEVKELQERVELLSNGNHLVNNDLYKRISELEEKK